MSDSCAICLDTITDSPLHALPECGHNFHVNCIVTWFRSGRSNCPLCKGERGPWSGDSYIQSADSRFRLLRRMSNWKNPPPILKELFSDYFRARGALKCRRRRLDKYRATACGNFADIGKEIRRKERAIRRREIQLDDVKDEICSISVDQIVIPIRKVLYC